VSCSSATACTAVGHGTNGTLAERWDGNTWTVQPTPSQGDAIWNNLYSVSCTSATACTAVGTDGALTLAERWDGTTWRIQPTPNPSGATGITLSGVSCTSAKACTAVGNYIDSSNEQVALAEAWDGSTWTIQPTPTPRGATGSHLSGVSCTAAAACTAVGKYQTASGSQVTLAERYSS
jgi:hypothetical protein